jgi:PKD repeat protein
LGDTTTDAGSTPDHTYAAAGIYDVCLTVTDAGGLSDTACTIAVVYDPSGGFVTGGGWFNSPAVAFKPDLSLTGKANFGFVSKYKSGKTVPTGTTEFQFHAADLNFHSSSYDWLVVTGSNYARFKGLGTINGEGVYKFMLWAGDDSPDTFRIKIWSEDEIGEEIIYDNGLDQPIGGGSIVVHKSKGK